MRNPGFLKNRADASKAHALVKADHGDLSVKINLFHAPPPGRFDGPFQELLADAASSIVFQNGHAPDLCASETHYNPRRSHRFCCIKGQEMNGSVIVAVHLDLSRHTLFSDEDLYANAESLI